MKKLNFTIGLMLMMFSLLAQQRGRPYISDGTLVADNGSRLRGCYIYTDYYHNDPSEIRDGTKEGITKAATEYGMNAFHFYCGWYATPTGRYQPLADSLVKWTREAGVYLVITIGGWDKNGEFSLSKMREFWHFYAPRYADETHVIYEVYNEPEFVCNNPSSDATISMEVEAYDTIRKYAPNTHIIMRSYGSVVATADYLLQDIQGMEDGGVDFSNASMGYHGYYWCSHARKHTNSTYASSTELNIIPELQDEGYAFINTEFERDSTLHGNLEYSGELIEFYENDMQMSWLCFYSFPEISEGHEAYLFSSSTDFKNEIDALSGEHDVTWCPDHGTWPEDCGTGTPTATAGSNSPVCVGEDLNLTESGGDAENWEWSGPNSFSSTDQNPTITNVTTSAAGTYTVTITDANSNTATDDVTVTVNSLPTATAGSNSPVCEGDDISLTENGGDATSWNWSGPNSFSSTDQDPTISSASTSADGTYSVTVTDDNGCTNTDNVDVTVNTAPTATASSNSPVDEGDDINLTESGGDATSWSWSGPNSFSSTDQNPTISAATTSADGTYTVTVTDDNGCENTDDVDVTVNSSSSGPAMDTINPIDDATVYNDSPDRNYGNKSDIKVVRYDDGHDEQAYIKFDLSHLKSSGTVSSAKLRLFVGSWNSGPEHFLKVVNDNNWSEDNITWNNRPTDLGDTIAEHTVTNRSWNEIEFNTDGITALENALGSEFSINISTILTEGITSFTKYSSSEDTDYMPELIIDGSNIKSGKAVNDIEDMTTDNSKASIKLYPNPLKEEDLTVNIKGFEKDDVVNVVIYNVNGKKIYLESFITKGSETSTIYLEPSMFNSGIYLIKVFGNIQSISKKLIVR